MERTDEVDTSQLLKSLKTATGEGTLEHGRLEALDVARLSERKLVLVVGADLSEFFDQGWVINIESSETGERLGGVLVLALLDQEARSLGKNEHADDEDQGPGELNGDRDAVGPSIIAVLGGVVDNGSEQETNGDRKLVATNNGTTDPLWRRLGLVQRHRGRNETWYCLALTNMFSSQLRESLTNTETGEETTSDKERDISSGSLEDHTEVEDPAVDDQTETTTKSVGNGSRQKSTEEGTGRQDRDDQRGLRRSDGGNTAGRLCCELFLPVVHGQNTADGTGVISMHTRVSIAVLEAMRCSRRLTQREHHQRRRRGR